MTIDEIKFKLMAIGQEETVLFEAPDYANAFLGLNQDGRAIYDYEKMVNCLVDDGMTEEEAREWIEYNTIRSLPYQQNAPIVLYGI